MSCCQISSFLGEEREKYERKEKKKIPEPKQDDLQTVSILISITRKFHRGSQSTVERGWLESQIGLLLVGLAKDSLISHP